MPAGGGGAADRAGGVTRVAACVPAGRAGSGPSGEDAAGGSEEDGGDREQAAARSMTTARQSRRDMSGELATGGLGDARRQGERGNGRTVMRGNPSRHAGPRADARRVQSPLDQVTFAPFSPPYTGERPCVSRSSTCRRQASGFGGSLTNGRTASCAEATRAERPPTVTTASTGSIP